MAKNLKFAWRRLRATPGFTLTAILTLALAIGANTAVFSIADAVLFRPLPYEDSGRVFNLVMQIRQPEQQYMLVPTAALLRVNESSSLSDVGLLDQGGGVIATTPEGSEAVPGVAVTANYFDILGVGAYRGRTFREDDDADSGRIALLSYEAWQRRLGGDEGVVGSTVTFSGTSLDVIGVLPPGFIFPSFFARTAEVVRLRAPLRPGDPGGAIQPIVRLEPGVSRDQADAELEALVATLNQPAVPVLADIKNSLFSFGRRETGFLLAAAGLVLLIGCANLALLLLVRGQKSMQETGVRAALGATRGQLVAPVIVEACLLGLAGAGLAVLVTSAAFDVLLSQVPRAAYENAAVGVSWRVALYSLGLGLLGGLVFSAIPAWRSARRDAQSLILGRQAKVLRRGRLGSPLIAVQVALAVILVFGAVTVTRQFVSVLSAPLGFDPENVLTVDVTPSPTERGIARQNFYLRIMDSLRARADVIAVGAGGKVPLTGRSNADEAGGIYHALPGFFETLRIPLLRGRLTTMDDVRGGAEAAVVSEETARELAPGGDVLGRAYDSPGGRPVRVIGVIADVPDGQSDLPTYVIPGGEVRALTVVIRMRGRSEAALADIRREVSALAPGRPVRAAWWTDSLGDLTRFRNPRFQTLVLGGLGGLALVLSALGIFAVVAFSVAVRKREMGIRIAVGAQPRGLVALIVRQSLVPVIAGLGAGLLGTLWVQRLAEVYLTNVSLDSQPAAIAAAAFTVTLAAVVAAYLPARRASHVDAVEVLRAE